MPRIRAGNLAATPVRLHIGEWIQRLGSRPVDVARAAGITESYLSELINNRKKNPSYVVLADIADFLGVPMDSFRRRPPPADAMEAIRGIDPATLERLKPQRD